MTAIKTDTAAQSKFDGSRHRPTRPFAAVGAVVINDQDQVLLIKRGKPPRKGEWSLPGGAIEVGETIEMAVVREVKEETGLDVVVQKWLMNVDSVMRDEDGTVAYHYVLLDYLATVKGGALAPASDALDARFFPFDEAVALVNWSETQSLLTKAKESLEYSATQ